jgi:hypothetical protein
LRLLVTVNIGRGDLVEAGALDYWATERFGVHGRGRSGEGNGKCGLREEHARIV